MVSKQLFWKEKLKTIIFCGEISRTSISSIVSAPPMSLWTNVATLRSILSQSFFDYLISIKAPQFTDGMRMYFMHYLYYCVVWHLWRDKLNG